jgi:hypothetical protein
VTNSGGNEPRLIEELHHVRAFGVLEETLGLVFYLEKLGCIGHLVILDIIVVRMLGEFAFSHGREAGPAQHKRVNDGREEWLSVDVVGVGNKGRYSCGGPENFPSGSCVSLPLCSAEVITNILIPEITEPYSRHVVMHTCCGDALHNTCSGMFHKVENEGFEHKWM